MRSREEIEVAVGKLRGRSHDDFDGQMMRTIVELLLDIRDLLVEE